MDNTLLVGLSRQVALARELDVVANNIANMNTAGFKADGSIFEEFLSPTAQAASPIMADRKVSFVQDRGTWHDLSTGAFERTGNPLDVAIDGKGFLVVNTPRGERYTRNGSLQIGPTGTLVTSDGFEVARRERPDHAAAHRPQHFHQRGRHDQRARGRVHSRYTARQASARQFRPDASVAFEQRRRRTIRRAPRSDGAGRNEFQIRSTHASRNQMCGASSRSPA